VTIIIVIIVVIVVVVISIECSVDMRSIITIAVEVRKI